MCDTNLNIQWAVLEGSLQAPRPSPTSPCLFPNNLPLTFPTFPLGFPKAGESLTAWGTSGMCSGDPGIGWAHAVPGKTRSLSAVWGESKAPLLARLPACMPLDNRCLIGVQDISLGLFAVVLLNLSLPIPRPPAYLPSSLHE